jgi:hypothetical protein
MELICFFKRFFGKLEKCEDNGDENFWEGKIVVESLDLVYGWIFPQHAIVGNIYTLLSDLCARSIFGVGCLLYIYFK